MIDKSIVFRLLTAEEAAIVSGGSSPPSFGLINNGHRTEGQIMNADGKGNHVTVYSAKNNTTTQTNEAPYQDIALVPYPNSNSNSNSN